MLVHPPTWPHVKHGMYVMPWCPIITPNCFLDEQEPQQLGMHPDDDKMLVRDTALTDSLLPAYLCLLPLMYTHPHQATAGNAPS
jgi:hypothetical protein